MLAICLCIFLICNNTLKSFAIIQINKRDPIIQSIPFNKYFLLIKGKLDKIELEPIITCPSPEDNTDKPKVFRTREKKQVNQY